VAVCLLAGSGAAGHESSGHADAPPAEPELAAPEVAGAPGSYRRSTGVYQIPDETLVDGHGNPVSTASLLAAGQPMLLNFLFTSCTTVCPVATATFAAVRRKLGPEAERLRLVSISIDPEHDTPARLLEYARRQDAGSSWLFLTGEPASVRRLQQAFEAYRGDKASHVPLTFLRGASGPAWLRIEGFPTAADLVREYRELASE
jgi:protein SCO1/2